ncbi:aminotransferase class I/II-fold pyridoxal phosphate-dependent enzyme [Brachybacterium sp. EF45031]|uniref:aminotransferase class I/II-fold pyridoxal phosphate-dependent enzyme n=1 Tax=Brachybacterium sillae TaxID=2810536 RepID=UPI00217CF97B|nr:aminotransferase class I/II-fold pyridoxal phosphate-dependent enzyme [Brachybacterium sillae]MCS6711741.1 aminotransferase class I/II-fold pyridoxal phosphate-dependent enzyme [Brachybacterium sillae]
MDTHGPWRRAAAVTGLLADSGEVAPTIFARMSALAADASAVNLGQGFPDGQPPTIVADAAVSAIRAGVNQYPPGPGTPTLRRAIADHQRHRYGLQWDPEREVLVTTGATEALAATLLALVSPGQEVLTLEPYYDAYAAMIALAGGIHRTVRIEHRRRADGTLELDVDPARLREAITDRTRLILLNTPHNPTGLVLDRDVLAAAVEGAIAHDALIVCDEVYEHLILDDDARHLPPATLPGAQDRTLTIGSAGKSFRVTGWKIGWVTARPALITAVTGVKQWLTYTSGAPFQDAVAVGLAQDEHALTSPARELRRCRDLLVEGLRDLGLPVTVPAGGYFVLADAAAWGEADAEALCERLPQEAGVAMIPVSAFHPPGGAGEHRSWVRVAFCKDEATIREGLRRLGAWRSRA